MGEKPGNYVFVYSVPTTSYCYDHLNAKCVQETFGEDPWLSGHLATAYITGIQGGIITASLSTNFNEYDATNIMLLLVVLHIFN